MPNFTNCVMEGHLTYPMHKVHNMVTWSPLHGNEATQRKKLLQVDKMSWISALGRIRARILFSVANLVEQPSACHALLGAHDT